MIKDSLHRADSYDLVSFQLTAEYAGIFEDLDVPGRLYFEPIDAIGIIRIEHYFKGEKPWRENLLVGLKFDSDGMFYAVNETTNFKSLAKLAGAHETCERLEASQPTSTGDTQAPGVKAIG